MEPKTKMIGGANFTYGGTHRVKLWRVWDDNKPKVLIIMLNPSSADEQHNDPTITRVISFMKAHGYGGVYVGNLWSKRTEDPKKLLAWFKYNQENRSAIQGVQQTQNIRALLQMREHCLDVVFAWGANGKHYPGPASNMERMFPNAKCFGSLTKDGHPKHPLFLKADTPLWPYKGVKLQYQKSKNP